MYIVSCCVTYLQRLLAATANGTIATVCIISGEHSFPRKTSSDRPVITYMASDYIWGRISIAKLYCRMSIFISYLRDREVLVGVFPCIGQVAQGPPVISMPRSGGCSRTACTCTLTASERQRSRQAALKLLPSTLARFLAEVDRAGCPAHAESGSDNSPCERI
jgi:hypothetical protein